MLDFYCSEILDRNAVTLPHHLEQFQLCFSIFSVHIYKVLIIVQCLNMRCVAPSQIILHLG